MTIHIEFDELVDINLSFCIGILPVKIICIKIDSDYNWNQSFLKNWNKCYNWWPKRYNWWHFCGGHQLLLFRHIFLTSPTGSSGGSLILHILALRLVGKTPPPFLGIITPPLLRDTWCAGKSQVLSLRLTFANLTFCLASTDCFNTPPPIYRYRIMK